MFRQAGLAWADELEVHVSGSAITVTKKQMSANDLREAMGSLAALDTEFKERANEICACTNRRSSDIGGVWIQC